MATVEIKMQSHGSEHERCGGCEQIIPRGTQMAGVRYDNGEPAGWHCDWCMAFYTKIGRFDPAAAEAARAKETP